MFYHSYNICSIGFELGILVKYFLSRSTCYSYMLANFVGVLMCEHYLVIPPRHLSVSL